MTFGRRALLLLAAAAFWVGLLEGAARLWIGWHGDALDRTMTFLRADAGLGWAQREDWRGDFLGQRLVTNEAGLRSPPLAAAAAAARRILVLGPSSAMGWGVPEEATYSRRLEALLRRKRDGTSVAVVNAGEIGYSAWQGLRLYRSAPLRTLKPDVVVVAYGANDPDVHRFFFDGPQTDAEALGPGRPAWPVAVQNALRRLLFLHVGTRAALQAQDRLRCGRTEAAAWRPAVRRVPLADFTVDLRELLRLARADGARPVLMTTAFRFPVAADPARAATALAREKMEEGTAAMSSGRVERAARAFAQAAAADPTDCRAERALAAALSAGADCAKARAAAARALRCEPARLGRDLSRYNDAVRVLARSERVPLVDAERLLAGDPAALLLDPVHPSESGHALIAAGLERSVEALWTNEK